MTTSATTGHQNGNGSLPQVNGNQTSRTQSSCSDDFGLSDLISCLSLDKTFSLSLKFYKCFESKAFHPSYQERNHLVALSLQAKHGTFDSEKVGSSLGALDFVGRDRRQAWADLENMSREEAKQSFIEMLDNLCPRFQPFILAHLREEEAKRDKEAADNIVRHQEEQEMVRKQEEEQEMVRKQEEDKRLAKKKAIQEMLNRQTYSQFLDYAQQAYPGEEERQAKLIEQLQESHYQQYMQQVLQHASSSPELEGVSVQNPPQESSETMDQHQPINESNPNQPDNESNQYQPRNESNQHQEPTPLLTSSHEIQNQYHSIQFNETNGTNGHHEQHDNPNETETSQETEDESSSPTDGEETSKTLTIDPPKMWTRSDVEEFKESVKREGTDGVIILGHGEIVTINVPTHDQGSCIVWEFSTDFYDIGFGVLFEFLEEPGNGISVQVTESDDEEDEEADKTQENQEEVEKAIIPREANPNVEVVLPIFRRDSQEAVYAGSHFYPGKGVYRLKFDNSYSLWRSKTLYYRVYYSK